MKDSFTSVTKYAHQKSRSLTKLGALEILYLLHQNRTLSFSEIFSRLCVDLDYISLRTVKQILKLLLRYQFITRKKKKKGPYSYRITEIGNRTLRWLGQSPLSIFHPISVCDKCFSIYEAFENRSRCSECWSASLLKGIVFNGIFIEEDGEHFFPIDSWDDYVVEDKILQKHAIRGYFLSLLIDVKQIGLDGKVKSDLIAQMEKANRT